MVAVVTHENLVLHRCSHSAEGVTDVAWVTLNNKKPWIAGETSKESFEENLFLSIQLKMRTFRGIYGQTIDALS